MDLNRPWTPSSVSLSSTHSRQAAILSRVMVGVLCVVFVLLAIAPLQSDVQWLTIVWIYAPLIVWHGLCFFLLRRGWVRTSAVLYTSFLWLLVTVIVFVFGGMSGQSASVYLVVVLLAAFTLGELWGVLFAAASSALAVLFVVFADNLPPPIAEQGPLDHAIALVASLTMCSVIAYLALRQLNRALRKTEVQAKAQASSNEALRRTSDELEVAASLSRRSAALGVALLQLRGERDLCEATLSHIEQAIDPLSLAIVRLDDPHSALASRNAKSLLVGMADLLAAPRLNVQGVTWVYLLGRADRPSRALVVERRETGRSAETFLEVSGNQLSEALLREELDQRSLRTERLEALGQLSGGVAHDFNNLLVVMQGSAELLERALPQDRSDLRELAQDLLTAGARAADLTGKLLAFARPVSGHSEHVDVGDVAREVHDLLRRVVDRRIELVLDVEIDLPMIAGPRTYLHQVLFNLCVNARDAMPSGGRLDVSVCAVPGGSGELGVQIGVSDTGVGMDVVTRRRMFEPFFTTKSAGKGTGLGLSTVWGIVHGAGGSIDVRSALGQGTRFLIWWPAVEALDDVSTEVPIPVPLPANLRILLVDDDRTVRRAIRRMLEAVGCRVALASGGEEALRMLRDDVPDLVLSDVSMPNIDGPAMLRELRLFYPDLPVLFITGYSEPDEELDAPVLVKPFSSEQLAREIALVVSQVGRGD